MKLNQILFSSLCIFKHIQAFVPTKSRARSISFHRENSLSMSSVNIDREKENAIVSTTDTADRYTDFILLLFIDIYLTCILYKKITLSQHYKKE